MKASLGELNDSLLVDQPVSNEWSFSLTWVLQQSYSETEFQRPSNSDTNPGPNTVTNTDKNPSPNPGPNPGSNTVTNTDQLLALAAVILWVPESPRGSAVVVSTDELALAVRIIVAIPLPWSTLPEKLVGEISLGEFFLGGHFNLVEWEDICLLVSFPQQPSPPRHLSGSVSVAFRLTKICKILCRWLQHPPLRAVPQLIEYVMKSDLLVGIVGTWVLEVGQLG